MFTSVWGWSPETRKAAGVSSGSKGPRIRSCTVWGLEKTTHQLHKRKPEFAVASPVLFWSGPRWTGWCPPLLVRGIFFTRFTDSTANVSWVCLCECFTSCLGILSPGKLTHEINRHNQINPESDDSFTSNLLCNFGQFSCLLYAAKSLTLKRIVINLMGSYASRLFCALENGEKGDIYSNHWIEELLFVARGRSSGPPGFPEASEDRYLSICTHSRPRLLFLHRNSLIKPSFHDSFFFFFFKLVAQYSMNRGMYTPQRLRLVLLVTFTGEATSWGLAVTQVPDAGDAL